MTVTLLLDRLGRTQRTMAVATFDDSDISSLQLHGADADFDSDGVDVVEDSMSGDIATVAATT